MAAIARKELDVIHLRAQLYSSKWVVPSTRPPTGDGKRLIIHTELEIREHSTRNTCEDWVKERTLLVEWSGGGGGGGGGGGEAPRAGIKDALRVAIAPIYHRPSSKPQPAHSIISISHPLSRQHCNLNLPLFLLMGVLILSPKSQPKPVDLQLLRGGKEEESAECEEADGVAVPLQKEVGGREEERGAI
ncbi:hypothetical protein BDQ12DRAFT_666698 [Crucibulum laeve]|uniref:Uncharacterized protein n=1 Tax=Crucibulum laeve TaxID=68775 RepID=A0A5C3LYM3_9AGAR|nr:hypothetical protein BDQ12DRAFT_666698 [Crucibulum laeve]